MNPASISSSTISFPWSYASNTNLFHTHAHIQKGKRKECWCTVKFTSAILLCWINLYFDKNGGREKRATTHVKFMPLSMKPVIWVSRTLLIQYWPWSTTVAPNLHTHEWSVLGINQQFVKAYESNECLCFKTYLALIFNSSVKEKS